MFFPTPYLFHNINHRLIKFINCITLKKILQHTIHIIFSNNIAIHFIFIEIKEA
jgi:hypothetical protein